jgi:hypothetical protein
MTLSIRAARECCRPLIAFPRFEIELVVGFALPSHSLSTSDSSDSGDSGLFSELLLVEGMARR